MKLAKPLKADLFKFDADEAVELTIHHLRLAAVFFLNTPEDNGAQLKAEFKRIMQRENKLEGLPNDFADDSANAGAAWINAMLAYHEILKKETE